jgi:hypothetical protein
MRNTAFLFFVVPSKVAKASSVVPVHGQTIALPGLSRAAVDVVVAGVIALHFANGKMA